MINSLFTQVTLGKINFCMRGRQSVALACLNIKVLSALKQWQKKKSWSRKIGVEHFSMYSHHFLEPVVDHCGVH